MNKSCEMLEKQGKDERSNEDEDMRSVGGISTRSNSNWSLSQRIRMSDDRLSNKEVNKLKGWVAEKEKGKKKLGRRGKYKKK